MTDLTEQWKKGELPSGLYYVKTNGDSVIILGWSKFAGWYNIKQVLAPVPSYEEWKKAYECVVSENEEITTLKKLLKDARNVLKMVDTYSGDYDSINGFLIVEKINQALGEDK